LKDYLNKIDDDEILDLPVLVQEHHHFTYKKFYPTIELPMENVEGDAEEYEHIKNNVVLPKFDNKSDEVIHNIATNGPHKATEWNLDHEKQFILELIGY